MVRLLQLLRRKPFRLVRVVMRCGQRYDIVDPDKVAVGLSEVFLFLPPSDRMKRLPKSDIELIYEPRDARHARGLK